MAGGHEMSMIGLFLQAGDIYDCLPTHFAGTVVVWTLFGRLNRVRKQGVLFEQHVSMRNGNGQGASIIHFHRQVRIVDANDNRLILL